MRLCFLLFIPCLFAISTFAADPSASASEIKPGSISPDITAALVAAGNASSEKDRLRILEEVQKRSDLPAPLREDLAKMIELVNKWVNNYELSNHSDKYLFNFYVPTELKKYGPSASKNPQLKALLSYYIAKMYVGAFLQGYSKHKALSPEDRLKRENQLIERFVPSRKMFPANPIIGMYCGYPVPWPEELAVTPDPNAPEWANLQREGLEKLAQVLRWWIHNYQKPEGFYGTGWGDDCEAWRIFVPVTVAFEDKEFTDSQRKMSEGIFAQGYMKGGFSDKRGKGADAEHTSEDSSDTISAMLCMAPDEQIWKDRALRIVGFAKDQWSGKNERGQLQFKATFFSLNWLETDPAQACDTMYHVRALQPAMILWQREGTPAVGQFVNQWMDTWRDVTLREENGKPAGITPTTIHWPDGKAGALSGQWWKPGNFPTVLYDWPSAVSLVPNTMLLSYQMTGDKKYLDPIFAMARHRRDFLAGKLGDGTPEGSLSWAASKMVFLAPILSKYRLLTGDQQFDDLLKDDASGYVTMRLTGDRSRMVSELKKNAEAFRVNMPVYTSETGGGDRVMVGPERYFGLPQLPHPMAVPDIAALYETATGNPDLQMYCPINAVRWLTPPKDIAALVTDSGQTKFAAELYHFGEQPREMAAELLLLKPGKYSAILSQDGKELNRSTIEINQPRTQVKLTLPPRQLCQLQIEPAA